MSVFTPKRVVLFAVAVLLGTTVFASYPSPRTQARMAFDTEKKVGVLFGGRGPSDGATGLMHNSSETWLWTGSDWVPQFPANRPPGRASHSMAYDTQDGRVIMFGGRQEATARLADPTFINDTWIWADGNWTRVETGTAPSPRASAAMAYDSDRDVVVLFGGTVYGADGKTTEANYETWEFDGSTWTRVATGSPEVIKPMIEYDRSAKQMIMLGVDKAGVTRVMYLYHADTHSWEQVSPQALPTCINEGHLVYRASHGRLFYFGGICIIGTPAAEEAWEWNGTNWTKLTTNVITRNAGQAVAYDPTLDRVVVFGGNSSAGIITYASTTLFYRNTWFGTFSNSGPSPRSLATFSTDPINNTIWMVGGLDELSADFIGDFWGYRNGQWFEPPVTGSAPAGCETPLAAFDTDRSRLVLTCTGSDTYEFDGTEWKTFTLEDPPDDRNYAGMVYDQKLKKVVLFGGYRGTNYKNDTWTWDGTKWTEVDLDRDEKPEHRGLMAMWYDPLAQKTILYGGFGRPDVNTKVTRYSDMWAFDGSRWTKLNVSQTPGQRFGPQITVVPTTGKVLLFGGLRAEQIDEDTITQTFVNDTWTWDGSASQWTQLSPQNSPPARENGMMAWDPVAQEIALFGGYANGFYFTDVWRWDGQNWIPRPEGTLRRRSSGPR